MAHFLVKLGRSTVAKYFVPALGLCSGVAYQSYHYYGHDMFKNLYTAFGNEGVRESPSIRLAELVNQVERDLEDCKQFNRPYISHKALLREEPTPEIRFFISSSLDPIFVGMTEAINGVTVGIPQHFNYEHVNELPNGVFTFANLDIFKKWNSSKTNDTSEDKEDKEFLESVRNFHNPNKDPISIKNIDRNSEEGCKYAEALILTDDAKKFATAKVLFKSDSYLMLFNSTNILTSTLIPLLFARGSVKQLQLMKGPLTPRLSIYAFSTFMAFIIYNLNMGIINRYFEEKSDKRALDLGPNYCDGAVEYFTKARERNLILRSALDKGKSSFDENGNERTNIFNLFDMDFSSRIKMVTDHKVNLQEKIEREQREELEKQHKTVEVSTKPIEV